MILITIASSGFLAPAAGRLGSALTAAKPRVGLVQYSAVPRCSAVQCRAGQGRPGQARQGGQTRRTRNHDRIDQSIPNVESPCMTLLVITLFPLNLHPLNQICLPRASSTSFALAPCGSVRLHPTTLASLPLKIIRAPPPSTTTTTTTITTTTSTTTFFL